MMKTFSFVAVSSLRPITSVTSTMPPHEIYSKSTPTFEAPLDASTPASMANVKHVKRNPPRDAQSQSNDAAPERASASASRPREDSVHYTSANLPPAAFPSHTGAPPPAAVSECGPHNIWPRLQAYQKGDKERMRRAVAQVDKMYSTQEFPVTLSEKQREWYEELIGRWLPGETGTKVSCPATIS
jgi:hypothetical protein